jgi:hypothetical protein
MFSNSNLIYALAAMTALALGLGASFWRSAAENKSLLQVNLTAVIALEAAQDQAKALRETLAREIKARQAAEAAQTVAEISEGGTREKLMQEIKAKQAADARLHTASAKLAEEAKAREAADLANMRIVAALEAANADLAQEGEARRAAELRRDEAAATIAGLTVKLNEEVAARNAAQEAIAGEMEAREKAVTMKVMQAVIPMAGGEGAPGPQEVKAEANGGARPVLGTLRRGCQRAQERMSPKRGLRLAGSPSFRRTVSRGGTQLFNNINLHRRSPSPGRFAATLSRKGRGFSAARTAD